MRISDWSSDVCSSDLKTRPRQVVGQLHLRAAVLGQAHHGAQSRNGRCFTWRANTSTNCGSSLAPHTASAWPTIHSTTPGSHCCSPIPTAAASVPLPIASDRGAHPSRSATARDRKGGGEGKGGSGRVDYRGS